jgi:hypothetical protein
MPTVYGSLFIEKYMRPEILIADSDTVNRMMYNFLIVLERRMNVFQFTAVSFD